jgi:hypothetical protein
MHRGLQLALERPFKMHKRPPQPLVKKLLCDPRWRPYFQAPRS